MKTQTKNSKVIKTVGISLFFGIVLVVFMLYTSIKTKSTDISHYAPFRTYIGQSLFLNKDTYLFVEDPVFVVNKDYPYSLLDPEHEMWQSFQDRMLLEKSEVKQITSIPSGTKIAIEKAVQYTNGVSGFSTPIVFGSLILGETQYKVSYRWGNQDLAKFLDQDDYCWKFDQAPWQEVRDRAYYKIPDAKWW
ncbi:hypothetical protein [Sphingobacterium sp. LRF_L2]|uniref:hypothetical protein n=1 Tax=Sphingobacterium sp. LRF_L2 TaxID=3369421 RepID=UPI003F63C4A8